MHGDQDAGPGAPPRSALAGLVTAAVLGVLVLFPLARRGYVLTYDMVFVPEPPLTGALLGLGPAVARAVPSDAIVALLALAVPADLLQKLILFGIFAGGGWGAARLVPSDRALAQAAAATFFVWNAYVYERLLLGHWTLLVSYAALPWVVRAALDLRRQVPGAGARLVAALAVACFASASGGLVATGTALAVAGLGARRTWLRAALIAAAGALLSLPWLVPTLLRPGGLPARSEGVDAFAAAADTPLGTLGSLLTLGGIWNADVVPPGRGLWVAAPALLVLLGLALAGLRELPHRWGAGPAAGLAVAAAAGLVLAIAGATPLLADGLRALVRAVPGAGLLRDGQRYLAPLALAQALGFGLAADRALRLAPRASAARALLAAALVAAPVLTLPVLAAGAGGRLATVAYPEGYAEARAVLREDRVPGAVLVLPWSQYLAPSWNGNRTVFDPARRWFPRRTIGSADLTLRDRVIPGEDPSAAAAAALAGTEAPLARRALAELGIRYVVLSKVGDWHAEADRLDGLDLVVDAPALRLYRAPPPHAVPPGGPPRGPVLAGTALAAATAVAALALIVRPTRRILTAASVSVRAHRGGRGTP